MISLGVVIVILAISFYAKAPSEWFPDLALGAFGTSLIALVFVISEIMRPRPPPQKD